MICIIKPDFWEWVILTFWLRAFHLPPYLLIPVGCWEPSVPPVFHTTELWAYLDSLIKSLFLRLLCAPKGFASRQLTFIKDSVENTWDELNSAVPVQNSNACSVRTRCETVWLLGNCKPSPRSSEAGAFAGDSTEYQGILDLSSVETPWF